MISSKEHNESTFNQDSCTHTNAPNCLGCFTHTDPNAGSTYYSDVPVGLRLYADWDDPATDEFEELYHQVLGAAPKLQRRYSNGT